MSDNYDSPKVEELLRSLTDQDMERVAPPTDLWSAIKAEIEQADLSDNHPPAGSSDEGPTPGVVIDLTEARKNRRPRIWAAMVAAAALVIVAGVAVASFARGSGDEVAASTLTYEPGVFDPLGADAAASVSLLDDDGNFILRIDEARLPTNADGDLELWLIQPDAEGNVAALISLGLVDPEDPGDFAVPADYDPADFFVVDISVEPHDGDPAHSGRSILRGPLA